MKFRLIIHLTRPSLSIRMFVVLIWLINKHWFVITTFCQEFKKGNYIVVPFLIRSVRTCGLLLLHECWSVSCCFYFIIFLQLSGLIMSHNCCIHVMVLGKSLFFMSTSPLVQLLHNFVTYVTPTSIIFLPFSTSLHFWHFIPFIPFHTIFQILMINIMYHVP